MVDCRNRCPSKPPSGWLVLPPSQSGYLFKTYKWLPDVGSLRVHPSGLLCYLSRDPAYHPWSLGVPSRKPQPFSTVCDEDMPLSVYNINTYTVIYIQNLGYILVTL